jgi:hypothetical protein
MLQFKINKEIKKENGWAHTTKTGIYGIGEAMEPAAGIDRFP